MTKALSAALKVYQKPFLISGCLGSNCEVQTQYQKGIEYFSYITNQTRFDDDVLARYENCPNAIAAKYLSSQRRSR